MSQAEQDGYITGLEDLRYGRWDGDNVIPPFQHMPHEIEWYTGYNRAYQENKVNN